MTINVPAKSARVAVAFSARVRRPTLTCHRCEIADLVFFRDVAHLHRLKLTVRMNVNTVMRLDLIGLQELIGMVDGDEVIAG